MPIPPYNAAFQGLRNYPQLFQQDDEQNQDQGTQTPGTVTPPAQPTPGAGQQTPAVNTSASGTNATDVLNRMRGTSISQQSPSAALLQALQQRKSEVDDRIYNPNSDLYAPTMRQIPFYDKRLESLRNPQAPEQMLPGLGPQYEMVAADPNRLNAMKGLQTSLQGDIDKNPLTVQQNWQNQLEADTRKAQEIGFGSTQEQAESERNAAQYKVDAPWYVKQLEGENAARDQELKNKGLLESGQQNQNFEQANFQQLLDTLSKIGPGDDVSNPKFGTIKRAYPNAASLNQGQTPSAEANQVTAAMQRYQSTRNPVDKATLEQALSSAVTHNRAFQAHPASPEVKQHVMDILSDADAFDKPLSALEITHDDGSPASAQELQQIQELLSIVRGH